MAEAGGGATRPSWTPRSPRGSDGKHRQSSLTGRLVARIVEFDRQGLSLRQIAARTGVSTATVRVALGRVSPGRDELAAGFEPDVAPDIDIDRPRCETVPDTDTDPDDGDGDSDGDGDGDAEDLVVLAPPAPRTDERAAARAGQLLEAPVVITQGAQLPLAGLLLCLPALAVDDQVIP